MLTVLNCCIVFNFYIKSQQEPGYMVDILSCIVFNFYIKSQPSSSVDFSLGVV